MPQLITGAGPDRVLASAQSTPPAAAATKNA